MQVQLQQNKRQTNEPVWQGRARCVSATQQHSTALQGTRAQWPAPNHCTHVLHDALGGGAKTTAYHMPYVLPTNRITAARGTCWGYRYTAARYLWSRWTQSAKRRAVVVPGHLKTSTSPSDICRPCTQMPTQVRKNCPPVTMYSCL